jgi:hypothetical protein
LIVAQFTADIDQRRKFGRRPAAIRPVAAGAILLVELRFVSPQIGTFGNSGRDNMVGPGSFDTDLAILKRFVPWKGARGEESDGSKKGAVTGLVKGPVNAFTIASI